MRYCGIFDLILQSRYPAYQTTLVVFGIVLICFVKQAGGLTLKEYVQGFYPFKVINIIIFHTADFGFARFLEEGNMAVTLCGSPMYMVIYVHYLC